MNYPVWQLDAAGGGLLIAMMAVFHVYISHFAVGGGLFLVLTEIKGLREKNQAIVDYVHKHTKFFLLLTLVAGSMTGVGIWFTIALLNPAATSSLIHTFVFAWAIEWVFFAAEIISLFIYYYSFGRMDDRSHVMIGWIYFACAWMSLFVINGIIDFMLTPGTWIQNHNFWSGYFNPTFWPALFFRSFLAFMFAGLFGFLTATNLKDTRLRTTMVRYCALWLLAPFVLFLGSAWWYRAALPPGLEDMIFKTMPELKPFIAGFAVFSVVLVAGGLIMAIRMPQAVTRPVAAMLLVIGLLYMGTFEFMREGGRRPYIIHDYMYSTSILKKDIPAIQKKGVLKEAKWVRTRVVTRHNMLETGQEVYMLLCLPCHSIGGPLNDIKKLTKNFSSLGLEGVISGMARIHPYMPPFAGTRKERRALAYYIAYGLNGRKESDQPVAVTPLATTPSSFDMDTAQYVLLAWSDRGMRAMTDAAAWTMLPPGLTLQAQLIRRGEGPEVVTEDVVLSYRSQSGFVGSPGLSGDMEPDGMVFTAADLPVTPYPDTGGYLPYPLFTVTAKSNSGEVLAVTQVVAPVATEMQCRTCHGGPWKVDGRAGLSSVTADNVLAAHDRLSGTNLKSRAASGKRVSCRECHADNLLKKSGKPGLLNLSAAMHGFHANFMSGWGSTACVQCHPASDRGATRAFRGIHHEMDLNCTNCHGDVGEHAVGLLKAEQEKGKARAAVLIKNLESVTTMALDDIQPRSPWINEPDCLNCHVEFQAPENDTTFNTWTDSAEQLFRNRTDESGQLRCIACHNVPHAVYPAVNVYGKDRDVLQPLQYQGEPYPIGSNMNCRVCHTIDMDEEMHHPNMLRSFRNQ